MITDKKRRKMAESLRNQAKSWRLMMPDIRLSDRRLTDSIHLAFGIDDIDATVYETLGKFADMIDRPGCRNVADLEKEAFRCSRCGCRVLATGSTPDGVLIVTSEAFPVDWCSCPACGAVVRDD